MVLCFVVANVAKQKNRSAAGFFTLSFFFSFLVGILVISALPIKAPSNRVENGVAIGKVSGTACQNCGTIVLPNALICRKCKTKTGTTKTPEELQGAVVGSFQQAYNESLKKRK